MQKILYNLNVPDDAQPELRTRQNQQVAQQSPLGNEPASSFAVSADPDEQEISGSARGKYADMMAQEFSELFRADGVSSVPIFEIDENGDLIPSKINGYYTLKKFDDRAPDQRGVPDSVHDWKGTIVHEGSHETRWRAVTTNTDHAANNDFGNDEYGPIGFPAAATKTRWYDGMGESEPATPQSTNNAEHGDVDLYDPSASSFDDPVLIGEVPYTQEARVDPTVWDDHDREKHDADGVNSWQHVFDSGHEFQGNPVLDNGLLRVHFDESAGAVSIEEWDGTNGVWTSAASVSGEWSLFDADVTHIGDARLEVQMMFEHDTNGLFALDAVLHRGWMNVQFIIPGNESGPVPTPIKDALSPVASTRIYDPMEAKDLVDRQEVRR